MKTVAETWELLCTQPWAELILTGCVSWIRGSVTQTVPQLPPAGRWTSKAYLLYHMGSIRQGDATRGESVTPRHQCVPGKNWPSATHFRYPQGGLGHYVLASWGIGAQQPKRSREQVWRDSQWFLFFTFFPPCPTQNPPWALPSIQGCCRHLEPFLTCLSVSKNNNTHGRTERKEKTNSSGTECSLSLFFKPLCIFREIQST